MVASNDLSEAVVTRFVRTDCVSAEAAGVADEGAADDAAGGIADDAAGVVVVPLHAEVPTATMVAPTAAASRSRVSRLILMNKAFPLDVVTGIRAVERRRMPPWSHFES